MGAQRRALRGVRRAPRPQKQPPAACPSDTGTAAPSNTEANFWKTFWENVHANPLQRNLAVVGLFFGSCAVLQFQDCKRTVEARLAELPPEVQQSWREGTYKPPSEGGG